MHQGSQKRRTGAVTTGDKHLNNQLDHAYSLNYDKSQGDLKFFTVCEELEQI